MQASRDIQGHVSMEFLSGCRIRYDTLSNTHFFSVFFVSVTYIRPPGFAWSTHGNLVVMRSSLVSAER